MEALGLVYLRTAQSHLRDGQTLVLAGCFAGETQDDLWVITGGCIMPQSTQIYQSNAQEADMLVWRHATNTKAAHLNIFT